MKGKRLGWKRGAGLCAAIAAIVAAAAGLQAKLEGQGTQAPLTQPVFERGLKLYSQQCAACHGTTGRGDGLAAYLLQPKPRDFTKGTFRIVSTKEAKPTDQDIFFGKRKFMRMEPKNGWGITGVLLAGGLSRRFGSPKALATWLGRTFSQHLLKRLELQCEEVLVSANDTGMFEGVAYRLIPDRVRDKGPLAGLLAVMEESRYPWLLVVSCDMPLVDQTAQKLLMELRDEKVRLVCFEDPGRLYPFPGLYHRDLMEDLAAWLTGSGGKVTDFIRRLPPAAIKILQLERKSLSIQKEFFNVNTRQDLEILQDMLH